MVRLKGVGHLSSEWPWLHNVSTYHSLAKREDYNLNSPKIKLNTSNLAKTFYNKEIQAIQEKFTAIRT